jgi:hypothetical protein
MIKRDTERRMVKEIKPENFVTQKEINYNENEDEEDCTEAEINQKSLKENVIKMNAGRLLHERNVYAFLGHLAEELIELNKNLYAECLAFLIVKRVMEQISKLKQQIKIRSHPGILKWD